MQFVPVLARHAVAKVTPEAGVARDEQLIGLQRHLFALQRVHDVRIVQAEHNRVVNLGKFRFV